MKKPVTPVGQPTDEQLTAHAAELIAFHTELAASAGLSEDGTTSTLSDDALGAKIDELAAARLAEVAELQTAGGASIGFADRVAAVKLVHAAEQKLAEVAKARVAAAESLASLATPAAVVPSVAIKTTVEKTEDGTEREVITVADAAADAMVNARAKNVDGEAVLAALNARTAPAVEASESSADERPLPRAEMKTLVSSSSHSAQATIQSRSEMFEHMINAANDVLANPAGSQRVNVLRQNRFAHLKSSDFFKPGEANAKGNAEILERAMDVHRSGFGSALRSSASDASVTTWEQAQRAAVARWNPEGVVDKAAQVDRLMSAAEFCITAAPDYTIPECYSAGTPYTDCAFTTIPSDRGTYTRLVTVPMDRSKISEIITDCPDGTPSNKVCFPIEGCLDTISYNICAQAICKKFSIFHRINFPEQIEEEFNRTLVLDAIVTETKSLDFARAQTLVQVATPFYSATDTVLINIMRAVAQSKSFNRGSNYTWELHMPWWLPLELFINEMLKENPRYSSPADVVRELSGLEGISKVCTYIDTPTTGPTQLWAGPVAAGPVAAFPATPEIMLIPTGMLGLMDEGTIDLGFGMSQAQMFGTPEIKENCLVAFMEHLYGRATLPHCGQAITIQYPGLCANGVIAPRAVDAICTNIA
jgi:hypothetical protein